MASSTAAAKLPPLVVYEARGMTPDTSLKVFDQEYHVHSVLLKMHSAFFAKFLTSPDKMSDKSSNNDGVRYRWVTKVDGMDKWHLVCDDPKNHPLSHETFKGDKLLAKVIFSKILDAIYVKPYQITTFEEFDGLVTLADYYCALPLISRTLNGALAMSGDSPFLEEEFDSYAQEIFELSAKLRHKPLFKEALILVAGKAQSNDEEAGPFKPIFEIGNKKLHAIAVNKYNEIYAQVAQVQHRLLQRPMENYKNACANLVVRKIDYHEALSVPMYMRHLYEERTVDSSLNSWEEEMMAALLENNLKLCTSDDKAGTGLWEEYFLCADISDADLPWDMNETDW